MSNQTMDKRNLKLIRANIRVIAMIMLSFMKIPHAKGETCVVESNVGGKTTSRETGLCGGDEHPCNHLQQCFNEREYPVKDIVIRGNYSSTTTVKIRNNVSIRGLENTIVTGPSRAFLVEINGNNTKVSVNITNMRFQGIGILKISKNADVSIFNCTATGVNGSVLWLHPEAGDIDIRLFESVFVDISGYVLKKASSANDSSLSVHVHADSCNFTRSRAVYLHCKSSMTLFMTNSVFYSNGSSVTVVANDRKRLSEVELINCIFHDTSTSSSISSEYAVVWVTGASNVAMRKSKFVKSSAKSSIAINKALSVTIKQCSFNGNTVDGRSAIELSKSSKVFISRCIFRKISGPWGASIAAFDTKTMVIHNCTFKHNRAGSMGGDMYLRRVNDAVFKSNVFENSSSGAQGGSVYAYKVASVLFEGGNIFRGCFTELYGGCIYAQETNKLEIKGKNSFYNCSSNNSGGCINGWGVQRMIIAWRNYFGHCSSNNEGGCIRCTYVKSVEIQGSNSFYHCSASGNGGCISSYGASDLTVKGNNTFQNCLSQKDGGCIGSTNVKSLEIQGGNSFYNCAVSISGGCVSGYDVMSLKINGNNEFHDCSSSFTGGCIAAYKIGSIRIEGRNSFLNCSSSGNGGCVSSNEVSNLTIKGNNTFQNCLSQKDGGCISGYDVKALEIKENNTFHNCLSQKDGGCIYGYDVKALEIKENNTFHNCLSQKDGGCIFGYRIDRIQIAGRNSFARCSAEKNGGCIMANRPKDVCIIGSVFTNNTARLAAGAVAVRTSIMMTWKIKTYILIKNCSFFHNKAKFGTGGALYFGQAENITILNSYFFINKARAGGGALMLNDKSFIHIAFTIFSANKATMYGGAIRVSNYRRKEQNYSSIISKCRFQDNEAKFGGALATMYEGKATSYQFTIEYTAFVNNSAQVLGQAIFNNEELQLHNVSVKAHEKRNIHHIYSIISAVGIRTLHVKISRQKSKIQVSPISSAVFISSFEISVQKGIHIACPIGFNVFTMNSSYDPIRLRASDPIQPPLFTYFTVQCKACSSNTYMMGKGKLALERLTRKSQPVIEHHRCIQCPEGAICEKDVRATDNHWGYLISQSTLSFKTCPEGYCCSKKITKCVSFNTCAYPRTGTLCGKCGDGFKLSFHSRECIPQGDNCNFFWFAFYVLVFSFGYTGTFVVVTNLSDILGGIKELIQTRRNSYNREVDSAQNEESISMIATPSTSFSIAGFVQIIVLYLQVALMLKVKYQGKQDKVNKSSTHRVFESMNNLVNFRVTLYQEICPSDSLTFPQKEAILFGIKMLTFCQLLTSMTIYALMIRFCRKIGISRGLESALRTAVTTSTPLHVLDEDNKDCNLPAEQRGNINFGHRLKFTYLKLLKLYFTPITQSALKMTHCVIIKNSYHLFVYGDLVCYTNWQIGIMTVILPGILLFPFTYDLSLRMLKKRVISSTNFVAASACPHYALFVYVCKYRSTKHDHNGEFSKSPEEEEFARRVLEAEDLFSDQENSLSWQTIQLYRTITMNVTTIIITNPMHRFLILAPILFLFCIHDATRKPYKDVRLNRLQALSSGCLLLVLLCNMVASVSFTADISMVNGVLLIVKVCAVVEVMLYAIVPLYLPLWKVWDILVSGRRKKIE